jgi:N,N'-diacetyllegionaminate synthase
MITFSSTFEIDGRRVGEGEPCYVIAEAGVSHFGSMEKAFKLVDMAADAKADAVKFQIFRAEDMISSAATDWRRRMGTRELPYEAFAEIQAYARERGVTFFATAHDRPSLAYLASLDVPVFKIGSGEVGNWPFLRDIASLGKPVILSTGMYELDDIAAALEAFSQAGNPNIAVLHCVTQYPTPPHDVNLRAMHEIRERFKTVTGYSDHTKGFHLPLAAVAQGARVIEKHITLEFDIPDAQDWKVSCGPEDLPLMVQQIRDIEAAFGSGHKEPVAAEREAANWARKSLVAARPIPAGARIEKEALTEKRPGTGIPPYRIDEVIGRTALRDFDADTIIEWEDIS